MLGGMGNPLLDDLGNNLPSIERYPQFYLSLDIDLTKIETRSAFLRTVFSAVGFLKIPAPAIEFRKGSSEFHWLHY